jgi:hypothetical protein
VKLEFGDLVEGFWVGCILIVVFDNVDEIGCCEETCECGCLRIPQWSGYNVYLLLMEFRGDTVLYEAVKRFLD